MLCIPSKSILEAKSLFFQACAFKKIDTDFLFLIPLRLLVLHIQDTAKIAPFCPVTRL